MTQVNVHEAKTNLSRLLEKAAAGEEIVIARAGEPVARLVAIKGVAPARRKGLLKGRIKLRPAFFEPLPEEVVASFEGKARR